MPDEKTIQVQGHGEVEAAPDVAVINLGVQSRESEPGAAMQAASQRMDAIIAAVRALGVPGSDIQTAHLGLQLDPQVNIHVANYQITVHVEDIANAGRVLDAAVEAGANMSSGMSFTVADHDELEDRALELAVADARRKADRLATALGVTIDGVERLTAGGGGVVPMMARRAMGFGPSRAPAAPTPVEGGQLRIAAEVQVTYTFQ
jgi:uncharacterized protein YggE